MNQARSVHIVNIPTSVYPNYNYLAAENSFLKQNIEYKDAVICEQQEKINYLEADLAQLSESTAALKAAKDRAEYDAARWQSMKKIILNQGGEKALYEVQKTVDQDIEITKRGLK